MPLVEQIREGADGDAWANRAGAATPMTSPITIQLMWVMWLSGQAVVDASRSIHGSATARLARG